MSAWFSFTGLSLKIEMTLSKLAQTIFKIIYSKLLIKIKLWKKLQTLHCLGYIWTGRIIFNKYCQKLAMLRCKIQVPFEQYDNVQVNLLCLLSLNNDIQHCILGQLNKK